MARFISDVDVLLFCVLVPQFCVGQVATGLRATTARSEIRLTYLGNELWMGAGAGKGSSRRTTVRVGDYRRFA